MKTERFSASRAARLMVCPGSANLSKAIPGWVPPEEDPEKGQKGQGHLFHSLMEDMFQLMTPGEMVKFAATLEQVAELRARRRFKMRLEHEFTADWLPSAPKTTVDLVLSTQDELHILDWKWGKIEVEVEDNDQLMFYARCAAYLAPKARRVGLHIAQPLNGGLTSHYVSDLELAQWAQRAVVTDNLILAGDTTLVPSDHGCVFCPANPHSRGDKGRPLCPVRMQQLYPEIIDEDEILNG